MRRIRDVVIAVVVLAVGAPVLAAISVLLRRRQGSPVLFRQARLGLGGQPFELLKFRTMTDERSTDGTLLTDVERLTPLGQWLRSRSLDELPELWNVVRGDMSLVGPRPLPVVYRNRFTANEARRMDIRPGLTGWAQVNGRNSVDWDERLAMDVWYVDHRTFWMDLCILARTVGVVLSRQGVAAEGSATMHELRPPSRTSDGRSLTSCQMRSNQPSGGSPAGSDRPRRDGSTRCQVDRLA
jgi:lipopolysaccharide/colanic/teichoic acid biosynthesis glycosyltransferase